MTTRAKERKSSESTPAKDDTFLTETDLSMKKDLPAKEVDRRLVTLARTHRQVESALSYYLKEVEERQLYLQYGHANTLDYARERLGFEHRKTRSLLNIARSFEKLPNLKSAFQKGDIPWTKAREVVKVANPDTDREWLDKTKELSNRQLEEEVRQTLPPVKKKTLVLVLEGDRLEAWEQSREACERLAGAKLSDIEVMDLLCAETLCTFALTPPFEGEDDGGYVRKVAERDAWQCTRPGCSSRTALTANHIVPRSHVGPDDDWNLHVVCCVCHLAITEGRLKVSGQAPDGLTWEGPFGIIEKPLPLSGGKRENQSEPLAVREPEVHYGMSTDRQGQNHREELNNTCFMDHVIKTEETIRGTPRGSFSW